MRIHRKVGRFRAVIAAVVLAIGILAVPSSALPASAQPAQSTSAQPTCLDPTKETFSARGVTVCEYPGLDGKTVIQKIDLNAGAKIRLISEGCYECGHEDTIRNTDLQYHKRTAPEWFEWLGNPGNFRTPGVESLFSTANGSFFVDNSPLTSTSTLSLPEKSVIEKFPDGDAVAEQTHGWAFDTCPEPENPEFCHDDLAWDQDKMAISFGDSTAAKQQVEMLDFPTHYTDDDFLRLRTGVGLGECCVDLDRIYGDQTVGRPPELTVGESPRTYVGVDAGIVDTVYILTTSEPVSGHEARLMLELEGAALTMQLDGGGSTQLAVDYNQDTDPTTVIESDDIIDRGVPDTLAVYLTPV